MNGKGPLDGVFAPLAAPCYRDRIAQAIADYQARGETASQKLARERHERKEARRAAGKGEAPDLLRETMKLYGSRGYLTHRTERYDAALKRRFDLFGCVDGLAIGHGRTVAFQATSWDNTSARVKKMKASKLLQAALAAGWTAVVVGWRRDSAGRLEHKEVWIEAESDQV